MNKNNTMKKMISAKEEKYIREEIHNITQNVEILFLENMSRDYIFVLCDDKHAQQIRDVLLSVIECDIALYKSEHETMKDSTIILCTVE